MKKIVLASKSLDRGRILREARVPFSILISKVNEVPFKKRLSNNPIKLVEELAKAKALSAKLTLMENRKESIIIAADTIIEFKGEIIGKAKDENQAFQILRKLAGNAHNLITGVAITETSNPKIIVDHDSTTVKFLNLKDHEIWNYVKTGEWRGRAGCYSARDKASLFVDMIIGSTSNVIGLPLHKVYEILKKEFNVDLLKNSN